MALALIRGFVRREAKTIGNFWVDLTRCTLYILIPISVVVGLVLVWQGVPQNLGAYTEATTLEGAKQLIAQGPVASQEIIKELGTNGGGFFNANSSHPFENPNAVTNLIELVAIFSIGAGLTNVLGRMVRDERQGWAIFAAMGVLFLAGVAIAYNSEAHGNPAFAAFHIDSTASPIQAGGNMEGKEVRFGPALSTLWATVTTDTSCGAVNSMHDSYLPIGGMVPLVNMQLGEVIFGGVGSGLYGILAFAIVAMFVAGLMVGRTPEYLGKKLEAKEVKMAILALLSLPLSILGWTALAVVLPAGLAGIANPGPHGFSEILYAFTEGTENNGSAFAGLSANTLFLQYDDRGSDADRALSLCHPDVGGGGLTGTKEIVGALSRHLPDPQPAICRAAGRRHPNSWRTDLFSGRRTRAGDRAGRDEPGQALHRALGFWVCKEYQDDRRHPHHQRAYRRSRQAQSAADVIVPALFDRTGDLGVVQKARSAHSGQEPGHVLCRDRLGADDRVFYP